MGALPSESNNDWGQKPERSAEQRANRVQGSEDGNLLKIKKKPA